MNAACYDLNRPLHLGRRDVFLEQAAALYLQGYKDETPRKRLSLIDQTLNYLQSALEHAVLAAKASQKHALEDSFCLFIRMLVHSLHSARTLLENEIQLQNRESALWQFLNQSAEAAEVSQIARGSGPLLEDVAHLFHVGEKPAHDLQAKCTEGLREDELERYRQSRLSLSEHLESDPREYRRPARLTALAAG